MEKENQTPKLELTEIFVKKAPPNYTQKGVLATLGDESFEFIGRHAPKLLKFSGTVTAGSYLMNFGKLMNYEQQLAFVNNSNFASVSLLMFGLFSAAHIIRETVNTSSDGKKLDKTLSMWSPFKYIFMVSFLIPHGSTGESAFSAVITSLIHLAQKIPL